VELDPSALKCCLLLGTLAKATPQLVELLLWSQALLIQLKLHSQAFSNVLYYLSLIIA
jgi:hypothetical protein